MYHLNTCICIEFLHGRLSTGYQIMRETGPQEFRLPVIVVAELYFDVEHSSNPERELRIVEQFVSMFQVPSFNRACAREHARIRQELGRSEKLIGDRDIMIAATAISCNATLVTRNVSEFRQVKSLPFETWEDVEL